MASKKDCIFELLKNGSCDEIPSSPLVGFHSAILFNKNIIEVANNGELMAELQAKAASYYNLYIVFNFMDLTLEPESLGAQNFWGGGVPSIGSFLPYDNASYILDLGFSSLLESSRIKTNLKAVFRMFEKLNDNLIGAYVSGPLTLLSQTFGATNILKKVKKDPNNILELLDKASKIVQLYIDALIENKAELIMILEPVSALLSPSMFENTVKKYITKLADHINQRHVISALHICGDTTHLLTQMVDTGVHILSVDKQVDIGELIKINNKIVALGNVGTVELLTDNPNEIYSSSIKTLEKTDGVRHILSSGCEVPVYSKPENLIMLGKAARDYSDIKNKITTF